MKFSLHPQLEADSLFVQDLPLSQLRLYNNATLPWLMLVPRRPDMREIHDLTAEDQAQLMREIAAVSAQIEQQFRPDKINLGMLGNIVPQLHIHIIGRRIGDPCWPAPVWGALPFAAYDPATLPELLARLKAAFSQ